MSKMDPLPATLELDPDTDNYAVLGNPISHSKSPLIHKKFAEQTGQSISYQAILVREDDFESTVRRFMESGGKGLNITVPFKQSAYRISRNLSSRAADAMAVNTLMFTDSSDITGDNTDGAGLVRDLSNNGITIADKKVLIIGAGGAVSGIVGPLIEQQPGSILIANRTLAKAQDLVSRFKSEILDACGLEGLNQKGSFDVIINGTSSGLSGELPPIPTTIISEKCCCYDMVYGDTETVFNRWCRENGADQTFDGLGMLVEQAAESFYLWRGVRPKTMPVIEWLLKEVRGEGIK